MPRARARAVQCVHACLQCAVQPRQPHELPAQQAQDNAALMYLLVTFGRSWEGYAC